MIAKRAHGMLERGRKKPAARTRACSVCLLAPDAYLFLAGRVAGDCTQRRQGLIARWLADRGHRVSVVTWDQGQPADERIDGIRVIKTCRRGAGLPGLRWAHPAWSSLCRAMTAAEAEVYVCDSPGAALAQMVMWCRGYGRRSVYAPYADCDCHENPPAVKAWTERLLHRRGVRLADRIVVADDRQQRLVYACFAKEAAVIPLPADPTASPELINRPMAEFETMIRQMVD
jgi:hypothetical protein